MKRMLHLFVLTALLSFLVIGCGQEDGDLSLLNNRGFSQLALPAGAVLQSATLNIYVNQANNQVINVHRATADWDEITVTWNNFGMAFDPTVVATFTADAVGWKTADLTTLTQDWLDGTFMNYGILIDQAIQEYPRAEYASRESFANHAYLEICYMLNGQMMCENTEVIADAFMWELEPNNNYGTSFRLYTGWVDETFLEKMSLLRFELEKEPQGGCSHTIGYWKTHAGFGPQDDVVTPLLPIWLGDAGGSHSLEVTTAAMAVDVLKMKTYGKPSNGITKLMAQLLGAKLSIADGASDSDIADAIADADAFLAANDWTDWNKLSKDLRHKVLTMMSMFDDYNNGYIGPGHCDEFDPDHDYKD